MRILYITNNLSGKDGWSRYGADLAKEAKRAGHKVFCLVNKKDSAVDLPQEEGLLPPLEYLRNPLKIFFDFGKIKKSIKKIKPDIIHVIVEPYVNLPALANIKRAKFFLTVHGSYAYLPNVSPWRLKWFFKILTKIVLNKTDGIIAVSDYTRNYFLKESGLKNQAKIKVITNGVVLDNIKAKASRNKEVKKIIFVGILKPRKGIIEALEGLKFYLDKYQKEFIFDIIGDTEADKNYAATVKEKIKELGLEGRVFIRGKLSQEKLNEYYARADLLILTSITEKGKFEGFGLIYLEANSSGVPVIGSKNCGAEEAVIDGITGYTVDPQNPEEIARKISLVLDQEAIKSADCSAWAEKNDIKIKAKEIFNFYEGPKTKNGGQLAR